VTISGPETRFIETKGYHRFKEFCDACRRYRYIGLCYGVPGVGKTLSARHYANWDAVSHYAHDRVRSGVSLDQVRGSSAAFYTVPPAVPSPVRLPNDIKVLRSMLRDLIVRSITDEESSRVEAAQALVDACYESYPRTNYRGYTVPEEEVKRRQVALGKAREAMTARVLAQHDPTTLILIDEADRLKVNGLEQMRAIFDEGGIGLVLIGMPGLEKRLARYPQLYSRVGFVHEFKPLSQADVRALIRELWNPPPELVLSPDALDDEPAIATIIREARGNFRSLDKLLAQIGRVMEINRLDKVTPEAVQAARESLVIGTA
jgi:DNA transposition AAA+ family ATPase